MSISFQLKEGKDAYGGKVFYFEVKSDALLVASVELLDWDDVYALRSRLRVAREELEDVYRL